MAEIQETTVEEKTIFPQFEPIIGDDGSVKTIGVNIVWKKKTSTKENITFMMCTTYKEAINKLLKVKGGWNNIDIISIQIYNRETLEYEGYPILAEDVDGVIYQMKKEWEESK